MNVVTETGLDIFRDIQSGIAEQCAPSKLGKLGSTQTSTLIIGLVQGYFSNFSRRWAYGANATRRDRYITRCSKDVFNFKQLLLFKKVLSVGFYTELFETYWPPKPGYQLHSSRTGHNIRIQRFTPYQTEEIQYPLAIYVCIIVLIFVVIIAFLSTRTKTKG